MSVEARRLAHQEVRQMLATMLVLQEDHNRLVAPDWRQRGFAFQRAIWIECAELLDHYGWKWWKLQQADLGQVRLELVDIWHFGLSMLMVAPQHDLDASARALATADAASAGATDAEAFRRSVEQLARDALDGEFQVERFAACMSALPLGLRELFEGYVGKNVLNRFRQQNGYAAGSYRKLWAGREDNVHLLELTAGLDPATSNYVDALHLLLAARYRETALG